MKLRSIYAYMVLFLWLSNGIAKMTGNPNSEQGKGFDTPFINNVFVISIGVDYTDRGASGLYCEFCENDAWQFNDRMQFEHTISQIGKIGNSHSSLYSYTYTGANATMDHIQNAFDSIELLAQPNDAVIFFYSGITTPGLNENGEIANQFLLHGASVSSDSISGPILSMKRLKFWLNKVRARCQMMIVDAGRSEYYMPEFFKNLSVQSDFSLEVNNRKRVFIYPTTYGFDYLPDSSGMLSFVLSQLDSSSSLIDLFTESKFERNTETKIRKLEEKIVDRDPYASRLFNGYTQVFKEWEFASQYGFLFNPTACLTPPSQSRGGITRRIEVKPGNDLQSGTIKMKNHAILIATNEYESLSDLYNPVADARALADLLQKDYGFHTILITDGSEAEVSSQLMTIKDTLQFGPYDQLLVFIAGHGMYNEDFKAGFVAFSDSRPTEDDRFMKSYLQFHQLVQFIENFNCNHTMLILDVCYGGAIRDASMLSYNSCQTSNTVNWNDLYAELNDADFIKRSMECSVRRYLTSGTYTYEVPDGRPGAHSPFCRKLLSELQDNRQRVISSSDLQSSMQRLSSQPSYGRFGKDVSSSDFLFIKLKAE